MYVLKSKKFDTSEP